jgi:hypothetical protein
MGEVIGQRWEIYDYKEEKDTKLKRGEKVFVKNTPDFGESVVELVSNEEGRSIEELYLDWKDGVGSPFRTSAAQDIIDKEILSYAKELEASIRAEAQTRATADTRLQDDINETNGNVADLRYDFNSWVGRGGFIEAFDFGTSTPTQEQLSNYALSQIPTISDPLHIWNNTKVTNLHDGVVWVLTNTQNTDPPVFEWSPQGNIELAPFTPNMGGYIVGGDNNDPPEVVRPMLNGKGKINLEAIMEIIEERMFFKEHPIGDVVVQYPGTASPIDKNWRGHWVDWTNRASAYRLRVAALPNNTVYTPGVNYAANAVVMWRLNTESGSDDWGYYKAKEAITKAAEQLDPVKWEQLKTGALVWRDDLQDINPWIDNDFEIGQQITRDGVDYWIEEIIVYGGKFFAAAGGNRPTFESGVAGDCIRNIKGNAGFERSTYLSPPFYFSGTANQSGNGGYNGVGFNASLVVPTGAENSPRTLSVIYWRYVA